MVSYINWKDSLNPSQEVAGSSPAETAIILKEERNEQVLRLS